MGAKRWRQHTGRTSCLQDALQPALPPSLPFLQDALAAKVEAEQRRYDELKKELQAWAAGLTLVCFAATLAFYGR